MPNSVVVFDTDGRCFAKNVKACLRLAKVAFTHGVLVLRRFVASYFAG